MAGRKGGVQGTRAKGQCIFFMKIKFMKAQNVVLKNTLQFIRALKIPKTVWRKRNSGSKFKGNKAVKREI